MRIGTNPEKNNYNLNAKAYHRIIIPVYIPHFDDYFNEAFTIFKLCLESLIATIHQDTRITIFNNNCHNDVKQYIDLMYGINECIDQIFHSKENLGKINAILAASKGNLEQLITITDADVLFKTNWQNEVELVFMNFPQAGMVSPVPSSKAYNVYTSNNWGFAFLKGKLFFDKVVNPDGLMKFDVSLGNPRPLYKPIHLEKYLVIENKKNKAQAVMGCGHFVATLRREVFDLGTKEPAFIKIQGGVENKFIDAPNQALGFLRLATKNNFAFHMGNTVENWMIEEFKLLNKNIRMQPSLYSKKIPKSITVSGIEKKIGKIFTFLIAKKRLKKMYFNYLGLNYNQDY